ncbi:MAG TPA: hypothetical protein VIW24_01220 [Aldersonia sp.]
MARRSPRGLTGWLGGAVVATAMVGGVVAAAPAAALPGTGSAAAVVNLNDYCAEPGAVAQLSDGRTVYCARVWQTDAYVWTYSRDGLNRDPNTRGYTCDSDVCRFPDGAIVPNYLRCGLLCGEPATSGDIQSGFADCFNAGASYEECHQRAPR